MKDKQKEKEKENEKNQGESVLFGLTMDKLIEILPITVINIVNDLNIPINDSLKFSLHLSNFFNGYEFPKCCLCPNNNRGGSYKLSRDNRWVHVSCAVFNRNVYFPSTTQTTNKKSGKKCENFSLNEPMLESIPSEYV